MVDAAAILGDFYFDVLELVEQKKEGRMEGILGPDVQKCLLSRNKIYTDLTEVAQSNEVM
jgi:hypothetical protein